MKRHARTLFIFLLLSIGTAAAAGDGAGGWRSAAGGPRAQGTGAYQIRLPVVMKQWEPGVHNMLLYLSGDERLYEVQHSGGSQARHQTQMAGTTFYHTKGNEIKAEWEELWFDGYYIYRGTDTSPGNGQYYTLRDAGMYGSAWAPRFWKVGELYERNPLVTFYEKSDCSVVTGGRHLSWLLFEAYHSRYTFDSGITLNNVVQLAWLSKQDGDPIERYYYAEKFGLVGWWSNDRGMSYVSEVHDPGDRPDNNREEITCLDRSPAPDSLAPIQPLPYWPGEHRR